MPRYDGTGPNGLGPRSGRGLGLCNGYPAQPFAGYGVGFGRGRGFRRMALATGIPGWVRYGAPFAPASVEPVQDKVLLANQAKYLESQLEQIKSQLKKLEE